MLNLILLGKDCIGIAAFVFLPSLEKYINTKYTPTLGLEPETPPHSLGTREVRLDQHIHWHWFCCI